LEQIVRGVSGANDYSAPILKVKRDAAAEAVIWHDLQGGVVD
jgi:hypothetical protein